MARYPDQADVNWPRDTCDPVGPPDPPDPPDPGFIGQIEIPTPFGLPNEWDNSYATYTKTGSCGGR